MGTSGTQRWRWAGAGVIAAVVVLATACAGSSESGTTPHSKPPARPNVLFVLTDDLDLGEVAHMPNVAKLLTARGTSFSHYFASVSICCPSRATTLRGQYAHNTGIETNRGTNGGFETAHRIGLEDSTIATWLQAEGYRTALIGKYLNGYPNTVAETYVPPGWDDFVSAAAGRPYSQFDYTLNDNGTLVEHGSKPIDYGTDVYVGKTVDFVTDAAEAGEPFFAYLSVYAPHRPATPAPRHARLFPGAKVPRDAAYNAKDVKGKPDFIRDLPRMTRAVRDEVDLHYRRRLQSLQAVDEGVARLVKTLKSNGQLANTYIVFASDNGFHLGQFRMPSGKQTAYDFDTRLPLIVRGPGVPQGRSVDALAGNVDLAPTFAAMAGVSAPENVDGRSLVPSLRGESRPPGWRNAYLVEHWRPVGKSPPGRGPLEPPDHDQRAPDASDAPRTPARPGAVSLNDIPEYHGVRTARYLYVEYATGELELYDTRADPDELHNLASSADPALLAELSDTVRALDGCSAETCRAIEARPVPG